MYLVTRFLDVALIISDTLGVGRGPKVLDTAREHVVGEEEQE
jgi:hypothetical protein